MSELSLSFYLSPGLLKTDQLIGIYYNQCNEEFVSAEIEIGEQKTKLEKPSNFRDMWYWNTSDSINKNSVSDSFMVLTINEEKTFEINLDKLCLVSQSNENIPKEELGNVPLFKFKSGIFIREEDFNEKNVSLEKVIIICEQTRLDYEKACSKNEEVHNKFEELCTEGFQQMYNKYEEEDLQHKKEFAETYNSHEEEQKNMPVSQYIDQADDNGAFTMNDYATKDKDEENEVRLESSETLTENEYLDMYPTKQSSCSQSHEETQRYLREISPMFPVDVEKGTFCFINEDDPDINAQRMLLFNVCHFMCLCSVITGITSDYRISLVEGRWKVEDRVTGLEIKDTMTKANVFDNQYRDAIVLSLKKAAKDLNCKESASIVSMINQIQNYTTKSCI